MHRRESADQRWQGAADTRRIVVVGPCASGKSTLVTALRAFGYNAHILAQEHSGIASLWQHSAPDVLIALDAELPDIRQRRDDQWPSWLYREQQRRLAQAFAAADLRVNTSRHDASHTFDAVVRFLERSALRP
jgi:dienelactone hydrolase